MWRKRLLLLVFLCSLSSVLFSLSSQEKVKLTLLLKRYQSNESSLLDQLKLSSASLAQSKSIIRNLKRTVSNSNESLMSSQQEVRKQKNISASMGESITILQSSFDKQKLQIEMMKYVIIVGAVVLGIETGYIVIDNYFGGSE